MKAGDPARGVANRHTFGIRGIGTGPACAPASSPAPSLLTGLKEGSRWTQEGKDRVTESFRFRTRRRRLLSAVKA